MLCMSSCVLFPSGLVGKQGVLHDPTCQSVRQLQKMLSSLLQRAHDSSEGLKYVYMIKNNIVSKYLIPYSISNCIDITLQYKSY